ncbi:hypothetical protein AVEN_964-1 [Araneus ventricosus]|uniref:Uncharacterized protein n=1 Tax=Araneus ventricosus TaxID=182803 RepID=A0A4Y2CWA6_ARAVE|nr:hypothetical protein AVEN_964-1 [Araneus ventricosus]
MELRSHFWRRILTVLGVAPNLVTDRIYSTDVSQSVTEHHLIRLSSQVDFANLISVFLWHCPPEFSVTNTLRWFDKVLTNLFTENEIMSLYCYTKLDLYNELTLLEVINKRTASVPWFYHCGRYLYFSV